jgi:hypothetical protein
MIRRRIAAGLSDAADLTFRRIIKQQNKSEKFYSLTF